MRINHNLMAMNTHRQMGINQNNSGKSIEKLSSGLRINKAGDDAAGLAISEKMRGQIRGLNQASRNAQDGISMVQTAEGALNETQAILQRMRELSVQSSNGTNTEQNRASIQDEMNQLTSEINRIGNTTEFNAQKVLNGGIDSGSGSKISQATSATKTLGAAMTSGTVTVDGAAAKTLGAITNGSTATAVKAKNDITIAAATTGAGAKITVDGIDFDASSINFAGVGAPNNADNKTLLEDLTGIDASGNTVKLSDVADVSVATTTATITSKTNGPSGTVETTKGASGGFNASVAEDKGAGTSVLVDGKEFVLDAIAIDKSDATKKDTSIADLNAVEAADGTKLSDVVDIEFSGDVLKLTAKSEGSGSTIEFRSLDAGGSDVADDKIGLATGDLNVANKAIGIDGSKVTVDNTTFDLGGVTIDISDIDATIEALENVTSGGTKLGDLVDITNNGGKLEVTAKSTGEASEIEFSGAADSVLGSAADDIGATNAVTGDATTMERAGLQAGNALNTTADISVAAGATFKVSVAGGSDVAVNLNNTANAKVYDTNNTDANVSKEAMNELVNDINSALQSSGLDGKVSASLSKDNEIQFISETGVDIEVKDGANTPLASNLGFTDKATDMGKAKNVEQIVGPGAQGSGFSTSFQIGSNKGQSMSLNINDMRSAALEITGNAGQSGFTTSNSVTNGTTDVKAEAALNVMTKEDASNSIEVLDKAIETVSAERGKLGAIQNRLEHTIKNLDSSAENLTAAESRIRDVDMAKEMMNFQKNNILQQAAQSMLAQAQQSPQGVLQLLR